MQIFCWWNHARSTWLFPLISLTHRGRVTHLCVSKLNIIGSDNGLSPLYSHYLNQCWNIVNWDPGNKLQWNINQNSWIFIKENPSQNVVWKMAAILSRPQCVNISLSFLQISLLMEVKWCKQNQNWLDLRDFVTSWADFYPSSFADNIPVDEAIMCLMALKHPNCSWPSGPGFNTK